MKRIVKAICHTLEKHDLDSHLIHWLKGNSDTLPGNIPLPRLDRKWVCYGGSEDVWRLIRDAFLAEFPNTLQEIEEKEEAARLEEEWQEREQRERLQREREEQEQIEREIEQERLQKEKEERERKEREKRIRKKREEQEIQEWIRKKREEAARIQREREEKEEAIGKVAERMEKERIQRVAQAKPDLAIIEKQVTRAGSGGCGCIIFSIISIIFIICVLVSCIEY